LVCQLGMLWQAKKVENTFTISWKGIATGPSVLWANLLQPATIAKLFGLVNPRAMKMAKFCMRCGYIEHAHKQLKCASDDLQMVQCMACVHCSEENHLSWVCPKKPLGKTEKPDTGAPFFTHATLSKKLDKCKYCGEDPPSHYGRDCPMKVCEHCCKHGPGHNAHDCPEKGKKGLKAEAAGASLPAAVLRLGEEERSKVEAAVRSTGNINAMAALHDFVRCGRCSGSGVNCSYCNSQGGCFVKRHICLYCGKALDYPSKTNHVICCNRIYFQTVLDFETDQRREFAG